MDPLFVSEDFIFYSFETEGSVAVYDIRSRETEIFIDVVNIDELLQLLLDRQYISVT